MRGWLMTVVGASLLGVTVFHLVPPKPQPSVRNPDTLSEQARIRNRLQLIETLLRAKDVSHLTDKLKESRKQHLDVLHDYWMAGNFPKNTNRSTERLPFFIDEFGTPCAVGHLMIESGNRMLAMEIAQSDNNIYADKITDPRFMKWASNSGLEAEELYLIQPSYDFIKPKPKPIREPSSRMISIGSGISCFDTASTFLMRDTSSSCGGSTTFCTTPLKCFANMNGQYLGGSVATCRADSNMGCPDLQACADDERQEFLREELGWRWVKEDSGWQPMDSQVAKTEGSHK